MTSLGWISAIISITSATTGSAMYVVNKLGPRTQHYLAVTGVGLSAFALAFKAVSMMNATGRRSRDMMLFAIIDGVLWGYFVYQLFWKPVEKISLNVGDVDS